MDPEYRDQVTSNLVENVLKVHRKYRLKISNYTVVGLQTEAKQAKLKTLIGFGD